MKLLTLILSFFVLQSVCLNMQIWFYLAENALFCMISSARNLIQINEISLFITP